MEDWGSFLSLTCAQHSHKVVFGGIPGARGTGNPTSGSSELIGPPVAAPACGGPMVTGHPSHTSNSSKNVAPGQGLARTSGPACSALPSHGPAGTGH